MSLEATYKGHFLTESDSDVRNERVFEYVASYSIGGNMFPSSVPGGFSLGNFDGAECLDPESVEICVVCGDRASGRHYGAISCEGCKGFFKRSIRKENGYICKENKDCEVNKSQRNRCQYCRMEKCLVSGMRGDSVQSERRPGRPSTNGIKKRAKSRNSSEWIDQAPKVNTEYIPTSSNIMVDDLENDLNDNDGEIGEFKDEKAQIFSSLDQLRFKLNKKSSSSVSIPNIDPTSFDSLDPSLVQFQLFTPISPPSPLTIQFVCESASRLLFHTVHWSKKISVFRQLSTSTQVSLLKSSWSDLFIMGLAQCKDQLCLSSVLTAIASHLQTCVAKDSLSLSRTRQLVDTLNTIKEVVNKVTDLALEPEEFAFLRLTTLFGPDQPSESLQKLAESVNDCVLTSFRAYYESGNKRTDGRFAKILLRTVSLRSFPADLLEELFFSGLIGDVKIESVIPYVLNMEVVDGNMTDA